MAKFWLGELSLAKSRGFAAHEFRELERMVVERQQQFLRAWNEHNPAEATQPLASEVVVSEDELTIHLIDSRKLPVPLVWFPRLLRGSQEQRNRFELIGEGEGIHWEELDEDISVAGLLRGVRASQPPSRSAA